MTSYSLADVELDEISLVDVGANQHAKIAIWKRAAPKAPANEDAAHKADVSDTGEGDTTVTPEELTKQLEALQTQVTDLTKRAEDAETAAATLTKAADEAGYDVQGGTLTKRASEEFVEIGGEKIAKSAVPASVLKALETQAADIAKMKADAQDVELAKRGAEELPNLAGTALVKGRLLASVGEDKDLLKSLKAADAALARATQEIGTSSVDETSATYRLNKMATDYSVAKGVPFETAYAEVTKSGDGHALALAQRAEAN